LLRLGDLGMLEIVFCSSLEVAELREGKVGIGLMLEEGPRTENCEGADTEYVRS